MRSILLLLVSLALATPFVMAGDDQLTPRIEQLSRAIEADPSAAGNIADRGFAYAALGEKRLAMADFEKAIQLEPRTVRIRWSYGWAMFAVSSYPEAVQHWEEAITLSPERPWWAGHTLALGYWMLDKKIEATKFYAEAVEKGPQRFATREQLEVYTSFWTEKERQVIRQVFDAWNRGYKLREE